jgi:hypothetical protein
MTPPGALKPNSLCKSRTAVPSVFLKRPQPLPNPLFDVYWRFAAERQAIFFRRLSGEPPPWTVDPILCGFKFTNAYRASDRTSQYLIRRVIYEGDQQSHEVAFRTLLFKFFNRIETWEALRRGGESLESRHFSPDRYAEILCRRREEREPIYSAAYIIPPVPGWGAEKHLGHLHLLQTMLKDELPARISSAPDLGSVYHALRAYPSIGRFLAFQFTVDLNYGPSVDFDEDTFVIAGPGAQEGIAKCFVRRGEWSDEDLIRWTAERQEAEFDRLGIHFQNLWGRPLKPVDCQNLYCEIGKYARVAHPSYTPSGGRSRIKQRFAGERDLGPIWYPPKWGLNGLIGSMH